MATTVYADPLTGTANSTTLPTGWTGSFSTGGVTKMNADGVGIVMQTGIVGGFADYTRLDLAATGTTALTDYEVFAWWYWSNPLVGETVGFYIRSSDDWANTNNPATWVRTQINNTGAADIRHRLSSGTQNLDASATVTVTQGISQKARLRVIGNDIYARYWDNNIVEPTGWTMGPVTMASDIVAGPGRSKVVLIGGSAASAVSARLRAFEVTDYSSGAPTPPAAAFVATPGRLSILRGRRRR